MRAVLLLALLSFPVPPPPPPVAHWPSLCRNRHDSLQKSGLVHVPSPFPSSEAPLMAYLFPQARRRAVVWKLALWSFAGLIFLSCPIRLPLQRLGVSPYRGPPSPPHPAGRHRRLPTPSRPTFFATRMHFLKLVVLNRLKKSHFSLKSLLPSL